MRTGLTALAVGLALATCDEDPGVDVDALQRRVELLEQQQREVAEKRAEVDEKLAEAEASRQALSEKHDATEARLEEVLRRVDELESAPKPGEKRPLPGRAVAGERYKVPLGTAQTKGSDTAKVTVVFWTDFQCPFCQRVQPTLDRIETEYGKDVRFAMKHNPLPMHPRAMAAAIAAEAAGKQGKYWLMHDVLWAHQKELTDENFVDWARDLKLDVKRFQDDLDDTLIETKIKAHMAEASTLGARGVPAFFINGIFLSGAQPFESFKKVIDDELENANALLAAGTPPTAIYDKAVSTGKTKPD